MMMMPSLLEYIPKIACTVILSTKGLNRSQIGRISAQKKKSLRAQASK